MSDYELLKEQARQKADKFLANFRRHDEPWYWLFIWFQNSELVRRFLGGKWELWVHDKGEINAVLSWHWVHDWSDKIMDTTDSYLVAKRWYINGRSISSTEALLKSLKVSNA